MITGKKTTSLGVLLLTWERRHWGIVPFEKSHNPKKERMGFLVAQQNKIQLRKGTFLPIVTFLSYIIVVLLFICIVLLKNLKALSKYNSDRYRNTNRTFLNTCLQDDSINNNRKCQMDFLFPGGVWHMAQSKSRPVTVTKNEFPPSNSQTYNFTVYSVHSVNRQSFCIVLATVNGQL